jgi:4-diphosphocytidyl-2-C-methyl-D-erythritol kinase
VELTACAPAKINLFLHITGRRGDGRHELQTVFQFLEWGDRMHFRLRPPGVLERGGGSAVDAEQDLILRAARRLAERAGVAAGARIEVDKRLPLGGGLGGGSSDAATTLLALNRLWRLGLSRAALGELALELGADVPVFVGGWAAWAEGVGERLWGMERLAEPWYLVVCPDVHASTAESFADPNLTRNQAPVTISDFSRGLCGNVFEPVVEARHPEVARARAWLAERAGAARMSGSGACLFAPVSDPAAGNRLLQELPPEWLGKVTRGLNRHPQAAWAA